MPPSPQPKGAAEVPFLTLFEPESSPDADWFGQTMSRVAPLGKRAGKRTPLKPEARSGSARLTAIYSNQWKILQPNRGL